MNLSITPNIYIIPRLHYNTHAISYLKKVDNPDFKGFEGFCLSWEHPTGQQTGQTSIAGKLEDMAISNENAAPFLGSSEYNFFGSLAQLIIPQPNIACQDKLDHDAPQPLPRLVGNHPEFNIPVLAEPNSENLEDHVYILPSVALTFNTQLPIISGAILFTIDWDTEESHANLEKDYASINIHKFLTSDDLDALNTPPKIDDVEGVVGPGGVSFGAKGIA